MLITVNNVFVSRKYDSESTLSGNTRKVNLDPDFHFFSDTELTNTTADSRPSSPTNVETVQSDTEFEVKKSKGNHKAVTLVNNTYLSFLLIQMKQLNTRDVIVGHGVSFQVFHKTMPLSRRLALLIQTKSTTIQCLQVCFHL